MTAFTGTRGLIRLVLRRDRWLLPFWIILPAGAASNFLTATQDLYPTAAERQEYVDTTGTSAAFMAMFGPIHGSDTGSIVAQRLGIAAVIVALISALTVIRHTRTEEAAGRRELLESTAVGRYAGLTAALLVTVTANVLMALFVAGALSSGDVSGTGALATGLALAGSGIVFAAVAGVAAQLTPAAGAARGIALAALGAAFVIRMAGDVGGAGNSAQWLSWLSPIGWSHRIRPFTDTRWWVLLLPIALTILLTLVAFRLTARRDTGEGLFAARPGPEEAAPALAGPVSLAWRLQRGSLIAWVCGFAVLGAVFGGVAQTAGDLLDDNQGLTDIFTRLGGASALMDAYLAAMLTLVALIAAAYAIQAALKLRDEEASGRAEEVLATPVARLRWAAGHIAIALAGPAVCLLAAGLVAGLVHGLNIGDVSGQVPRLLGAALVQLPAVWVLAAVAIAAFGLLPRWTVPVAWAVLAACFVFGQFGAALNLSQSLLDLSPFTHIAKLPGGDVTVLPLVALTAIAAALLALGLAGLRRRDVPVA